MCLECDGDIARPMRLGRQLARLYALEMGDFAAAGGGGVRPAVLRIPAAAPTAVAAVTAAADGPVLESFGG